MERLSLTVIAPIRVLLSANVAGLTIRSPMMKQPAENTNATPWEEKASEERRIPVKNPAEEEQEIRAEAERLSNERGGNGEWTEEEWSHASEIVRNRNTSLSKP